MLAQIMNLHIRLHCDWIVYINLKKILIENISGIEFNQHLILPTLENHRFHFWGPNKFCQLLINLKTKATN
jgi:hypothetical protein